MCKEKYINPFTDFGFKKLFGTAANSEFLISFLNSLFELEDRIVEITYRNVEQLGMRPDNRNAIFDLYCTTDKGAHIIVEMQNGYQKYFVDRSVFYSSFPMQEEAKRGDWDFRLPKIYTVAFLNFNMDDYQLDPNFKHVVQLVDRTTNTVFYDKLTYIYLEMKKFTKDIDLENITNIEELEKKPELIFDLWLYIIKHLDNFDEIPATLRNSLFERFFREAQISAFSQEERFAYEQSLKALRDYNNTIRSTAEKNRAEGLAEGLAKGLAEGIAKGKAEGLAEGEAKGIAKGEAKGRAELQTELVRKMLASGMAVANVASITGLSEDQVKTLMDN